MMSDVGIVFKVFAKDNNADAVLEEVKPLKPANASVEDFAFGIKVIKLFFKFDDEKTTSSALEDSLKALEHVSEVEVLEESLL